MTDYNERCMSAARSQGLDHMADRLTWEGYGAELAQTGGFCMALVIHFADDTVTVISGEGLDDYTIGTYTLSNWRTGEGPDGPLGEACNLTRSDVIDLLNEPRN